MQHYYSATMQIRVRLKIIGNDLIKNVGKFHSCMVSKLRIIFKRIVLFRDQPIMNLYILYMIQYTLLIS